MGNILAFIAEYPGAQIFMLLMGVGFSFSRNTNPRYVLKRAVTLLLGAYALNFFKFIIPLYFDGFPKTLLIELNLYSLQDATLFLFSIGDILHFAAIAYILIYLVSNIKCFQYWSFCFAIIVALISPLLYDIKSDNTFLQYMLKLIGGHPPEVFFPVFPWLAYPLAGLSLGYFLKRYSHYEVFMHCVIVGGTLILIYFLMPQFEKPVEFLPFYRTSTRDTLLHLGFTLMWLAVIHFVFESVKKNRLSTLLTFCSKNITSIYIIQWILICWGMTFTGYLMLSFQETLLAMFIITAITLDLTHLLNKLRAKKDI